MSQKFYESLKTAFDGEATLVTSPFAELYLGEAAAPADDAIPICVVEPGEEAKEVGTFASKYCEEPFEFRVVDSTDVLVGTHCRLIDAAMDGLTLSVSGLTNVRIDKQRGRLEQLDDDRWMGTLEYTAAYTKARAR